MTGLGLAPICQKPVRMHRVVLGAASRFGILRLVGLALISAVMSSLMSCGIAQNKIQASRSGSEVTSISKITPIAARSNEVVSLTGSNFYTEKNLKVSLDLANGERASVPLVITDTKTASFTMPEGAGLGVKDVTLTQGTAQMEVTKFNLIADHVDNQLPIVVGDGSTVCSDQQYIDRKGDRQTGTKDCAAGTTAPVCAADGVVGCVTTVNFKSAATAGAASKIISGQSVAGVSGNVILPAAGDVRQGVAFGVSSGSTGQLDPGAGIPASCSSENQTNCVATTNFPAVDRTRIVDNTSKILSDFSIVGVSGTLSTCAADGSNCFVPAYSVMSQPLKAINYNSIDATKMLSSLTISGVVGSIVSRGPWNVTTTFPGAGFYSSATNTPADTSYTGTLFGTAGTAVLKPADCSANNETGCVTTSTYKAADLTNLSAGNIKSTVTIAGVTGNYPSATSPLDGADTTDDLSIVQATRESQLRSATNFEFFMSDGTRVLTGGDSDIAASNIRDAVNIFGITGNVTAAVAPDPWNVRIGTTINGVAGQLKVNCRNRVRTAVYNYDGAIGSIPQTGVTSGSAIDIWDTIDDHNNGVAGLPPSVLTAWGSNTDCGGVEATAGDANVWKDVTTTSGGAASNCTTDAARCTMQDKITGLWWSKLQALGAWNTAWNTCQTTLNASGGYNGQTGWRLPTQKELMEAYTHGIRSAAGANWMTEANMYSSFWSGSSVSNGTVDAWSVNLANGNPNPSGKGAANPVVCVR
jgi:hypothetical protein